MLRVLSVTIALVLGHSAVSYAQTAMAGELSCEQPTIDHRIDAVSQPGHAFVVRQGLCRFTKAALINGIAQVEETFTGMEEIDGAVAQWRGRNTTKMANGDLIFVQLECSSKVAQDGTQTAGECTWTLVGGTGKMTGITGSGTSMQVNKTDPNSPWAFKGSYKMP